MTEAPVAPAQTPAAPPTPPPSQSPAAPSMNPSPRFAALQKSAEAFKSGLPAPQAPNGAPPPAPTPTPVAPQQAAPPPEAPTPAPEAKPESSPDKPLSAMEAMTAEPTAKTEVEIKAEGAYQKYKKGYEAHSELLPKYQKLEQEAQELRSKAITEELQKEVDELRNFRAAYDVEATPEFQNDVVVPWQKEATGLQEMAEAYTGVSYDELVAASQIKNSVKREEAIENAMRKAEGEVRQSSIDRAVRHAEKMNELLEKGSEKRSKAGEMRKALEAQRAQESSQREAKEQAEYKRDFETISAKLKGNEKLKALLDEKKFGTALERVAQPKTATERAFQAIMSEVSVELLEGAAAMKSGYEGQIATLNQEIAALKKLVGEVNGLSPTLTPQNVVPNGEQAAQSSRFDVLKRMQAQRV